MHRTNEQWVADLRAENPDALGDLMARLKGALAKGFRQPLSEADLDDLTQESIVRVVSALDSFQNRSQFTTWATSIAVNTALQELRRRKTTYRTREAMLAAGQEQMQAPVGTRSLERKALYDLLDRAMQEALSPRQRQVLEAKLSGATSAEITRFMELSPGAMYKLAHDARKRLKSYLLAAGVDATSLVETR